MRLYGQNEQRLAVKVWLSALRGVRHRSDKFALLGHLYQAYMDFGKYRYTNNEVSFIYTPPQHGVRKPHDLIN